MRSIAAPVQIVYEVQKSKFYSFLYPVSSVEEVHQCLSHLQKKYPDATHYCYAYIIDNLRKCSDDGEPYKTAGMPILNVLEKQNLNLILCIVVRYFGGILLGAGGLVRAYTTSATKALKAASFVEMVSGKELELVFSYEFKQLVDRLLQNHKIIEMQYQDVITYRVFIPNLEWENLKEQPYWREYRILRNCYCMMNVTTQPSN